MRVVALVPAAGQSRRMGRPKLSLSLGAESVIERVIAALERGGADAVLVVAPPLHEPGADVLANHARVAGAILVHCPEPTPDMRATIEVGLEALHDQALVPADGLLLTPGDVPGITPALVRAVRERFQADPTQIVVPQFQNRRGHPVALPWLLAVSIPRLPAGVGVNALLDAHREAVVTVPVDHPGAISDLDTPEDYLRWLAHSRGSRPPES